MKLCMEVSTLNLQIGVYILLKSDSFVCIDEV